MAGGVAFFTYSGLSSVNILSHPDYEDIVTSNWFLPETWGAAATPVSSGGRGSAWFIKTDGLSAVLRHYLRGGLVARISRASYVYLGEKRVRSFSEFRLLDSLHRQGLPVPKPVAASYWRMGVFWYRAALLIERLEGATPFADAIHELAREDWHRLGGVLRQFHDANVFHADLNCFNVLVQGDRFYLIDFDKGERRDGAASSARWKSENLARLYRSLERLEWGKGTTSLRTLWQALLEGYYGQSLTWPGAEIGGDE